MKILLTGGSGFIGKNIRESYLGEKHQIIAPSRSELDCFNDQSVEHFLSRNSFDVIIHSAAKPGHRNALDTKGILYSNSRMIVNLLKYQGSWGKFINMGSGGIYDAVHYLPKMKEEYFGTHIPEDEPGYTKYLMGLIFPKYPNTIDFRIFGIYGKYEDYAIRFISNAICKAIFDLPITIRQNRKFDYLHVDDLAPIVDHFILNQAKDQAYNITPPRSIELLQLAALIRNISGKKIDILVANEGMGMEYSGDNTRLITELGQVTFTPIEKGVSSLYEWYQANKANLDIKKLFTDK